MKKQEITLEEFMETTDEETFKGYSSKEIQQLKAFMDLAEAERWGFMESPFKEKGPKGKAWQDNPLSFAQARLALSANKTLGINSKTSETFIGIDLDSDARAIMTDKPWLGEGIQVFHEDNPDKRKVIFRSDEKLESRRFSHHLGGEITLGGDGKHSKGFYFIFAGTHENGELYKVSNVNGFVPTISPNRLAEFTEAKPTTKKEGENPFSLGRVDTRVPVGRRNTHLFGMAKDLIRLGYPRATALAALKAFRDGNTETGNHPVDDAEIERAYQSASMATEPGQINHETDFKERGKVKVLKDFTYVDNVIEELVNSNKPERFFAKSNRLVTVVIDEDDRPKIFQISEHKLKDELAHRVKFTKDIMVDDEWQTVKVSPPVDMVKAIRDRGEWEGIPGISGIVTGPVFSPDGTLEDKPGYLPKSGLYLYEQHPIKLGDTEPTEENVRRSREIILNDLLVDFPFDGQASRANAVAELIQPLVRPMIDGPTPLYLHDAPTPGSGKGLLADIFSVIFTGEETEMMQAGETDAEWRKRLTTGFWEGSSRMCFDNVSEIVDSAALSTALTTRYWTDRVLGATKRMTSKINVTWVMTGNNVQFSVEMSRRIARIRIIPRVEHPSAIPGESFKHNPLLEWVKENRSELLTAVIVLVKNWIAQGKPPYSGQTIGSYDAWSGVIGGILQANGIEGFMADYKNLLVEGTSESQAWRALFERWYEEFGSKPVKVADIFELASYRTEKRPGSGDKDVGENLLEDILNGTERARITQLGIQLNKKKDNVFGDYILTFDGIRRKTKTYVVNKT